MCEVMSSMYTDRESSTDEKVNESTLEEDSVGTVDPPSIMSLFQDSGKYTNELLNV